MASETIYQTPPLAGRPPFATDDDSVYDNQPQTQTTRRLRQPPPPDPNARTSAYNMYDTYLDNGAANRDSGIGALGMGLMNGDMDDEDPFDDKNKAPHHKHTNNPIPLAAPKPGYAAPVSGIKLPSPAASPDGRQASPQMSQVSVSGGVKPLTLVTNMNGPNSPRIPPPAAINVPSTPHPLQPPMTPIMPVFARPSEPPAQKDVKFASGTPILRSEKEDTLLPRRQSRWAGKGDDFWRRFSMVVKEESSNPQKESSWLKKTRSGSARTSRWVWCIGILLLICVAGGIGLGWYIAHNSTTHDAPTAIGGSANQKALESSSVAEGASSSTPHVSPTRTVARRDAVPTGDPFLQAVSLPLPSGVHVPLPVVRGEKDAFVVPVRHKRHKRHALNRTI